VDSFIQNIAAAFGLKCKSVSRERFGHLCVLEDGGLVLVQKLQKAACGGHSEAQLEGISFQHEVKEHLLNQDFGTLDSFFSSVQTDAPYHKAGDDVFTASKHFDHPKANFSRADELLAVVENLAKMHKTLLGANFTKSPFRRFDGLFSDTAAVQMAGLKKKIMKAGKFSDFDMLFLKGFSMFEKNMDVASVIDLRALGNNNNNVCHNLLKQENIFMGDAPIFTNFVMAGFGHPVQDLVYVVKRYLKAGHMGDLSLSRIFDAYNKHNPLEGVSLEGFCALLQYPDKFIKLSKDYYSKKRNFAPITYLARMEECFQRHDALEAYLKLR